MQLRCSTRGDSVAAFYSNKLATLLFNFATRLCRTLGITLGPERLCVRPIEDIGLLCNQDIKQFQLGQAYCHVSGVLILKR